MSTDNWLNGVSGNWGVGSNWSTGNPPAAGDTAVISAAPTGGPRYVVELSNNGSNTNIGQLTLNQTASSLEISGSLTVAGTVSLDAGTIALDSVSTLQDGTLLSSGGTIDVGSGIDYLYSAAIRGNLSVVGTGGFAGNTLSLSSSLTLQPISGSAPATLTLNSAILVVTSSNVSSGTIDMQGTDGDAGISVAGRLTLGTSVNVDISGTGTSELEGYFASSDAIINHGTMSVTGTAANLTVTNYGSFTNAGKIMVSTGDSLVISQTDGATTNFHNTGTISLAAGATASIFLDSTTVNTGTISGAGTLVLDGSFTTTQASSFVGASSVDIGVQGAMNNTGDSLKAGSGGTFGALVLDGGTITGGTLVNQGGWSLNSQGNNGPTIGTLTNVAFQGSLAIGAGEGLELAGTTTVASAPGAASGTVILSGYNNDLLLDESNAITNLTIDVTSPPIGGSSYSLISFGSSSATLAASSEMLQSAEATLAGGSLVNDGTMAFSNGGSTAVNLVLQNVGNLNASGGSKLTFENESFTNNGTMSLSGAQTIMSIENYVEYSSTANSFANTGTINISSGAELQVTNEGNDFPFTFTNTGKINITGGSLGLTLAVTTAQLENITSSTGGSLVIAQDLNNTGAVFKAGTGDSLQNVSITGTVSGGTLTDNGGGFSFGSQGTAGTLVGVSYSGTLNLTALNDSVNIAGGFTLTSVAGGSTGSINLTGSGASLGAADSETLTNTTISIGNASDEASLGGELIYGYGNPVAGVLTLASSVAVTQTGLYAGLSGQGTVVNDGKITDSLSGGYFGLDTASIVNAGTIAVSNGGTLELSVQSLSNTGVISVSNANVLVYNSTLADLNEITASNDVLQVADYLSLAGGTLTVGAGTKYVTSMVSGSIQGGTIHDAGGGISFYGQSALLQGITYQGTLAVNRPYASLQLAGGFTVNGINGTGAGAISLTGAGSSITLDSVTTLNNVTVRIGNAASSYDGVPVAAPTLKQDTYEAPAALALGANVIVDHFATFAQLGVSTQTFNSAATINANFASGTFYLAGTSFSNSGIINVSNGDDITEEAVGFTNAGSISIAGTSSVFSLDTAAYFQSGTFAQTSFTNDGTISIAGGNLSELTAGGAFPEVPLLNQVGIISGYGTLSAAVTNDATIASAGGTLTVSDPITGTGNLVVDAGSSLLLTSSVGSGQIADFAASTGVLGSAPLSFLGTISGWLPGATIDLLSTAASSAHFSGSSIVVSLTAGGTITLHTTSALTGTIAIASDGHGDSLLTYVASAGKKHIAAPPIASPQYPPGHNPIDATSWLPMHPQW